jgi:phage terminase small subunit
MAAKKSAAKAVKKAAKKAGKGRPRDTAPKAVTGLGKKSPLRPDGLTQREALFVLEYLKDQNATQAAIRISHSARSAHVTGCRYMARPLVVAAIAQHAKKLESKLEMSIERTLLEVTRIAYFDFGRLFDEDGRLKAIADLDDDTRAALTEIEAIGHITTRVKSASKITALDMLMKHYGLYKKDNKQKGAGVSDAVTGLLEAIRGGNSGPGLPVKP